MTGHIHLGPAIRTMRLAAGYSLREMARRIGVSPAYLSNVEREKMPAPTHERLRSLARVLGVPPRRLTALSERLSPDLVAFLEATPEAVRFLRVAREQRLTGSDFDALTTGLGRGVAKTDREAAAGDGGATETVTLRPLGRLLDRQRTWCRLSAATKADLLADLTCRVLRGVRLVDIEVAVEAVLDREAESSTGVGGGLALSHGEVPGLTRSLVGVCTLANHIDFGSIDGLPVSVVFLVLGGVVGAAQRLRILARIAQLCVRPGLLGALEKERTAKGIHVALRRADLEEY